MSNSVDNRIVEMQFDNAQFEKGISTSIKSLDILKKKLNLDKEAKSVDGLTRSGKNFDLSGMAASIEYVAGKFSAFGVLGVTTMQRISNAAITTGKNLVSSLTIDPVKSGLSEYETQINAIQTILSNTRSKGGTIEAVNEALDTLNTYADKTIYNFTEMTRNIGTFTAAGVELDTSTAAIKGIANLAAVSGSASQQASTAMYQISQALASGTIRLMDWNSVVNAGMGGEVFQDALKETARVHGIQIDKMIDKEGSFRDTLQNGWLTSDIMLETLKKFTGDLTKEQIIEMGYTEEQAKAIIALGKDANDAATKVKTFTQLIDTLKEALQSGWTQSWEYGIGNFEEARELWTGVSDAIGKVIGSSAEARNELLKGWYEAGGRTDLIEGLKDTFGALYGVVVAIQDAMRDIFPETTVDDLLNISSKVKEFGKNLKAVLAYRKELVNVGLDWTKEASPIEAFTKELQKGMKGDDVKKLQEQLKSLGYDIGSAGVDGIFGPKTEAALKEFQKKMGLAIDGVYKSSDHGELFKSEEITKYKVVSEYVYKFSDALEKVKHISKGAFAALNVGVQVLKFFGQAALKVLGVFKPIGSAAVSVAMTISDCFINLNESLKTSTKFAEWLDKLGTYLAPLKGDFESVKQAVLDFFGIGDAVDETPDKIDTFLEMWTAVKALAADKLPKIGNAIGTFFTNVYSGMRDFVLRVPEFVSVISDFFVGLYEQLQASEKFQNKYRAVADFLNKIKATVSEFFSTVWTTIKNFFSRDETNTKTLGESFREKLKVFETIGAWLSDAWNSVKNTIVGVWNSISSITNTVGVGGMLAIVGLIIYGVNAYKTIKNITTFAKNMSKAFADFSKSLKIGKKADKLDSLKNVLLSLSLVIATLVAAIYILGNMNPDKLKQGADVVKSVVGGLVLLATVATIIGSKTKYFKSAKNVSKALLQFAAAIGILSLAVIAFGHIDWHTFLDGVGKITVIATVLGAFMIAVNKLGGKGFKAAGLLAVSGAIGILALIARLIGGMDTDKFWKGAARITAIAVILGAFSIVVNKFGGSGIKVAGLLGITAAIGIIGVIASMLAVLPAETLTKGILAVGAIVVLLAGTAVAISHFTKELKIAPALVALGGFALIVVALGYALEKVRGIDPTVMISFATTLAITLAAVIAALYVVGNFGTAVAVGAGVIALIAAVAGAVIGILGAVDEHFNGAILTSLQRGGEILNAFGSALGEFFGGFAGSIIENIGKASGEALTTFGEAVDSFTEKIAGISTSDTLSSDIDAVIGVATAMGGFFDGLGGIKLNLTALPIFTNGTEDLSNQMDTFGTAISDFGTAVSGMSNNTFTSDTSAALAAATSIRDFLDGISSLDIEKNKGAIAKWITGDTKTGSLFSQMRTLGESISSLNTNFGGLSDNGFSDNVEVVKSSMTSILGLLTTMSSDEYELDFSNFYRVVGQMVELGYQINDFNTVTADVDAGRFSTLADSLKDISDSIIGMANSKITPETVSELTNSIGQISTAMETAGAGLSGSLNIGISSSDVDISGVQGICSAMLTVVQNYQDNFATAGFNLGKGLSKGLGMSTEIVKSAAKAVALAALNAAKNVLGIHSPSKEFEKVAMYSNKGFAGGLLKYASVVTNAASNVGTMAINSARSTLANLSAVIASDIDPTPVIRPVMDLSDVTTGVSAIDGMLAGTGSISLNAARSASIASVVSASHSNQNQNGSTDKTTQITQSYDNGVNLTGNNFYVRSEQDIRSLASEIAALTYQQQRNLGAK